MFTSKAAKRAFTLIELLVVVLILGILIAVALPSYLSSVANARTTTANNNAKVIATAVQANYVRLGGTSYLSVVSATGADATGGTLVSDLGGAVPVNPCTGGSTLTSADYGAAATATGYSVQATQGTNCNATAVYTVGTGA